MNHSNDDDRRREEQLRLQRQDEEERLTSYSRSELADSWQFKIVHGSFRAPASVQAVIAEQARHGWIFVEKFDNARIRFKRRPEEAAHDAARGGDPYATRSVAAGSGCVALVAGIFLTSLAVAGICLA